MMSSQSRQITRGRAGISISLLPRARINAKNQDLAEITNQAWAAIEESNNPPELFRHGGTLSRLERDEGNLPILRELTTDRMRRELAENVDWYIFDRNGEERPAKPPIDVVKNLLATPNPTLPVLKRITQVPVFVADGTLVDQPGYHEALQLYYALTEGLMIPPVSTKPTEAELSQAKSLILDDLLCDFPFVENADRAHAVGLLLLPFVRELVGGATPNHLMNSPIPGTGKDLLATVCLRPALGLHIAVVAQASEEEEWRRRITSSLRQAAEVIFIGNVTKPFDSGVLAAALTAQYWEDRLLGTSTMIRLAVRCVWVTTANNPVLSTELARRSIRIRLDAESPRPWERNNFKYPNLLEWVDEHRGDLIRAACILIQHWIVEGRPAWSGTPLGSYESWSRVIGGILEAAGIKGFLENHRELVQSFDFESQALCGFTEKWGQKFNSAVTASDLLPIAMDSGVNLKGSDDRALNVSLGMKLSQLRGQVIGDYTVVRADQSQGVSLWKLETVRHE